MLARGWQLFIHSIVLWWSITEEMRENHRRRVLGE
jgi:hypothetical protein